MKSHLSLPMISNTVYFRIFFSQCKHFYQYNRLTYLMDEFFVLWKFLNWRRRFRDAPADLLFPIRLYWLLKIINFAHHMQHTRLFCAHLTILSYLERVATSFLNEFKSWVYGLTLPSLNWSPFIWDVLCIESKPCVVKFYENFRKRKYFESA